MQFGPAEIVNNYFQNGCSPFSIKASVSSQVYSYSNLSEMMEAIQLKFPRLYKNAHNNFSPIIQYNLIRHDSESVKLFNQSLPCLFAVYGDDHFGSMIKLMESVWKYYNTEYVFIGLFVMNHKCVLLRRKCFAVYDNIENFLSKEFDLNIQEEGNQVFSEIVRCCHENCEALAKGYDFGIFEYYSREFCCLFRESCLDDFELFHCLEDGISQLEELKELFEMVENKADENCIKLLLGRKAPFFVLPHKREKEWNVEIQFKYWTQNDFQFYSVLAKPKDCFKKAWENFFDIKSLHFGIPITEFPPDYIETCDREITDLISKLKISEWGLVCNPNYFLKFNTKEEAEEFVKSLFSTTLADFIPNPPIGDVRFYVAVHGNGQFEIDVSQPLEKIHGCVVVNVNGELLRLGVVLKEVIEEKWTNFLVEAYNKTNPNVKETINTFHSKRRDLPLEKCFEYIFEKKVSIVNNSISCFGTERLTITFIGEWNGKTSFFKLSMQSSVNKEMLTYLARNNSNLRETPPNISQIYYYQSVEDKEKIEYFLDAFAKLRNEIDEEQVEVLMKVKSLDVSVQEYLLPITEILHFTRTNSHSRLCKHVINQCISILKQLDDLDILHQDISLDNLMIRKRDDLFELVLIDFDFSENYLKEENENSIRESINLDCDVTKHPYWCEKKKTSVGDIYSMSIVMFEIIYYLCFRIDYVGEYFSDLQNSGRFRIELVKYLRNDQSLTQFLVGNDFELFKQLMEYMLHFEQNPTLSTIIGMLSNFNVVDNVETPCQY